eukprot:2457547-Amphidinium_carterae.1
MSCHPKPNYLLRRRASCGTFCASRGRVATRRTTIPYGRKPHWKCNAAGRMAHTQQNNSTNVSASTNKLQRGVLDSGKALGIHPNFVSSMTTVLLGIMLQPLLTSG